VQFCNILISRKDLDKAGIKEFFRSTDIDIENNKEFLQKHIINSKEKTS